MAHEFFHIHEGETTQILGVELLPLSLGHVILLNWIESAFVTKTEPHYDDLVCAVLICSQDYKTARKIIRTQQIKWQGKYLTRTVGLNKAMKMWQNRVGAFDLGEKWVEFDNYMNKGCKHPSFSTIRGYQEPLMPSNCPFVQEIKVTMISRMGMSEDEVLDRAWARCLWDYYTLHMIDGNIRIIEKDLIPNDQAFAKYLKDKIDRGEIKINIPQPITA